MRQKAEKIPEEWVRCPTCGLPYGFINCRVSLYDSEGKRYEICLTCAVKADKERKLGVSSKGRTGGFGPSDGGSSPSAPANGNQARRT